MSTQTPGPTAAGGDSRISVNGGSRRLNPLYFAAWRWHFYAGLYVIPFLIMLSVTGIVIWARKRRARLRALPAVS